MSEEITQVEATETQSTQEVVEENKQVTTGDANAEGAEDNLTKGNEGDEVKTNTVEEQKHEPTVDELKTRLQEYEVREEEDRLLRQKLGLPEDMDSRAYDYMNIEQQIINDGKNRYLRLCTEYGVDADPSNIDKSIEALKASDPAKGYEFIRRLEGLGQEVGYKRQAINQQVSSYEINKFATEYNTLLQASPALNNIVNTYVQTYGGSGNMYNQLTSVMDIVMPAYQEAFEAGKRYALSDKARKDTSEVQGGVATSPTTASYTSGDTFTREQISKMSSDDFAKYEKTIRQQMLEGKIR
jgi:hypothetical protein